MLEKDLIFFLLKKKTKVSRVDKLLSELEEIFSYYVNDANNDETNRSLD